MGKIEGKQSGKGLKPKLNYADTGSVVNTVKSSIGYGYGAGAHPTAAGSSKNNMVSANASRRSGRGR